MDPRLERLWWTLRIAFGLTAFLAGLDKFFGLLVNWVQYLSPLITKTIPVSPDVFMRVVGVIEMAVGILVLTGLTRLGGYIMMAWLTLIALSLLTTGHYFDVAVRDLGLAVGAYAMARISEVREEAYAKHRVGRLQTV
ncbi:MAG TPA: DoxX family protein [Thermoanaerobaculia bacterium]|nr:DoxX family protein [Thermoanaerobaculia bacterium]